MSSLKSRKKQKLPRKAKNNSEEAVKDRISSLPDSILHHILRFLPTHCSVHTCVLSKRWKYIWTGVSRLDFNESQMIHSDIYKDIDFINFVEQTIDFHDGSDLEKFRLKLTLTRDEAHAYERADEADQIKELISKVLTRKIQKLNIYLIETFIEFPPSLYACTSLIRMKLHGLFSVLKLPASVCFPNLEIMQLRSLRISCEEENQRVSFKCPVLDEVMLIDCEWEEIKAMDIFAPKLVRMIIDDIDNEFSTDCELNFYAESLTDVDVFSCLTYELSFHNILSLSNANITIGNGRNDNSGRFSKLLQGFRTVKELILCYPTIRKLSSVNELLALSNLKDLVIPKSKFLNGELLTELFCSLPRIESLAFINGLDRYSVQGYDWSLEAISQSFLLHLKLIHIDDFSGNETELSLVKFLLKNAKSIKEISLRSSKELSADPKKQMEIAKQLLILPRSSTDCVVDFTY
ncbi:hypothetical protein ACHQM5_008799 [Ranunculus cassubicifolius]